MMPYCKDEGIAVTTFSPLARGYLAGGGSAPRLAHDLYLDWFGDEIDQEIARRVNALAAQRGKSPSQIAQAWVIGSGNSTVPLVGADSAEQVEAAIEAASLTLSADERAYLEEPYRPRDMINDYNPLRRARAYSAPAEPAAASS